jgi:nucleoside-diphosphate-sugar epimerase
MTGLSTALITGAGGFIGRHLVSELLAAGHRVIALDINLQAINHLQGHERLRLAQVDVRSHDAVAKVMAGVDLVFNLAAAHLEVGKPDSYYRDINIRAVEKMLETAAAANVRRFIHCSTVGVYGPLASVPADEQTPCNPDIAYEATKLAGERAVVKAAATMSTLVIRPSWVSGPDCPRTEKLLRSLKKRRFFFVGSGENLRHPIYVSDLLVALQLAATAELPSGEVIIAAGPTPVTTRQLVSSILQQCASHYRPPTLPLALVLPACQVLEYLYGTLNKQPPFSRRSLKFFTESSAFDDTKARKQLGFVATVELAEGLGKTIEHARAQGTLQ